jgi:hypothetical protein
VLPPNQGCGLASTIAYCRSAAFVEESALFIDKVFLHL